MREWCVCVCVCVNNSNKALGESGEKGGGAQKNEPRAHDSSFGPYWKVKGGGVVVII